MKPTEHNTQHASSPERGLCVTFRGRSHARRRAHAFVPFTLAVVFALALVLIPVVVSSLWTAPAAAEQVYVGPPVFSSETDSLATYPTRAHLVVLMATGHFETEWHGEYAPAQADGSEPPESCGCWVKSGEGVIVPPVNAGEVFLGTVPGPAFVNEALVRYLVPGTKYYARFSAENADDVGHPVRKSYVFVTPGVEKAELPPPGLQENALTPTTASFSADVEANGAETHYRFDYAPGESGHAPVESSTAWKPFSSGEVSGVIEAMPFVTVAGFANPGAKLFGLAPETEYYARVKAVNEEGEAVQLLPFSTPTNRVEVGEAEVRNVTGTSAQLLAQMVPHGAEASWRFEYATSKTGPWSVVRGLGSEPAEGVISQAQAEATPINNGVVIEGALAGLSPQKTYYVRLSASGPAGEGRNDFGEAISGETQGIAVFTTFGAPLVKTFAVHGLHGEALRVMGAVNPDSVLTSAEQLVSVEGAPSGGTFTLTFEGQTTAPIPFTAPAEGEHSVESALSALPTIQQNASGLVPVAAHGPGQYMVYFGGQAKNNSGEEENKLAERALPAISADASGLSPSGASVRVTVIQAGGEGYDTHYHFEYVSEKQYEAVSGGGFAHALSTPVVDLGSGDGLEYVGADLATLAAGETVRFRLVASNNSPDSPVVEGETQSLTVPLPVSVEGEGACPNQVLRVGLSALLPDCRAYEQLTPVDKQGSQEIYNYGGGYAHEFVFDPEGEHAMYVSPAVKWGAGAAAGESPYLFSRTMAGWRLTAASPQPEAGIAVYVPQVFSTDLTQLGIESSWSTSPSVRAPDIDFKLGPAGGPYATVASVPHKQAEGAGQGWVASSEDFSTRILQVEDHALISGKATGTKQGNALYEYAGGAPVEVNVDSAGKTIGECGATIPRAGEAGNQPVARKWHVVSADGSRVFFEATPVGASCGEATHVYERVGRRETIDLGAYRFVVANGAGSEVLLQKSSGEASGLYRYNATSGKTEFLPGSGIAASAQMEDLVVSEDMNVVYIFAREESQRVGSLYRYALSSGGASFITHFTKYTGLPSGFSSSPNGRYFYFIAETVAGLPGGAPVLATPQSNQPNGIASQAYRYDSAENSIQCLSCASTFDAEPRLNAVFAESEAMSASEDGNYVFFDTPAALVPKDTDSEVPPEGSKGVTGGEHTSNLYSVSSDVYEWRRDGLDGCVQGQGCLALITSGRGGFLNILLGSSNDGRDVLFATKESLSAQDEDTSMDIYDARIGGGFPEPAQVVECRGDSCSTPLSAPPDLTPASAIFQGSGNLVAALPSQPAPPKTPHTKKPLRKIKKRVRHGRKSKFGKHAPPRRSAIYVRRSK